MRSLKHTIWIGIILFALACQKDEPVYEEANLVVPVRPVPFDSTFGLTLFPNPSSDTLTIGFVLTDSTEVRWTIYDMSGQARSGFFPTKFARGRFQLKVSLAAFPAGVYFLIIDFGSTRQIRKIIKA